jgi:hypothetical protein
MYRSNEDDAGVSARSCKAREMRAIENQGYRILGVVGDQQSDTVDCDSGSRTFKIPNPM